MKKLTITEMALIWCKNWHSMSPIRAKSSSRPKYSVRYLHCGRVSCSSCATGNGTNHNHTMSVVYHTSAYWCSRTLTREIIPSVSHISVLHQNGCIYHQPFHHLSTILVFWADSAFQNSDYNALSGGIKCKWVLKNLLLSTNIPWYIGKQYKIRP